MTSTPKIQISEIEYPENTPLISVCKYAKSIPWAGFIQSQAGPGKQGT